MLNNEVLKTQNLSSLGPVVSSALTHDAGKSQTTLRRAVCGKQWSIDYTKFE